MKNKFLPLFLFIATTFSFSFTAQSQNTAIGTGGNAYLTNFGDAIKRQTKITDNGIEKWQNEKDIISIYFHVEKPQILNIALNGMGRSTIKVSYGKKSFPVKLNSTNFSIIPVGEFEVTSPGYVRIDLQGVKKHGESFGNIKELVLINPEGKITYVHDFSNYWGRRGPSVHLGYTLPADTIEWFYNELTVPEEGDAIGSYYMANGFQGGYFGIQHNSTTEKRVLFSVWSPYETDDPNSIPEEDRIVLLRKGENVNIGEFGNEGSGGQSFLRYNWTAGITYKFLTQIYPDGNGNTIYTAYFFATDENRWRLIASFLRPKTNTWNKNTHSFLENFLTGQGYLTRYVKFGNQWALDKNGKWHEITESSFTYDGTASAGVRLDYQGGLSDDNTFYLKNGGFFNENTLFKSKFTRKPLNKQPEINFELLKKL